MNLEEYLDMLHRMAERDKRSKEHSNNNGEDDSDNLRQRL